MRVTKVALLCGVIIVGASGASAAQAGSGNAQSPSVSLPFVVTNAQGAPVDDVTSEDISIRDDAHPAKAVIAVTAAKDLPLHLGLVVQDSGSMRGVRGFYPIISAADDFLKAAMVTDSDACFIGTFNASPHFSEWMARGQNPHFTIQFLQVGSSELFDSADGRFYDGDQAPMASPPRHRGYRGTVMTMRVLGGLTSYGWPWRIRAQQ